MGHLGFQGVKMICGLGTWFSSKQPEEATEGKKQKPIFLSAEWDKKELCL